MSVWQPMDPDRVRAALENFQSRGILVDATTVGGESFRGFIARIAEDAVVVGDYEVPFSDLREVRHVEVMFP